MSARNTVQLTVLDNDTVNMELPGKRVVVCFDGTWNGRLGGESSNIAQLANCLVPRDTSGVSQAVCYLPGVGSNYPLDRLFGGAFGLGIRQSILTGYRFLSANYEPGDTILLFGFSRGAYAARSLASMVHFPGLLRASTHSWFLDDFVKIYETANRATASGKDVGQATLETYLDRSFRKSLRGRKGIFRPNTTTVAQALAGYQHLLTPAQVSFLGVFDTVGALGRRGDASHNMTLSPTVQFARHALALDEHRMAFEPLMWEGPGTAESQQSAQKENTNHASSLAQGESEPERVKQVWFAGAHSDVGGGARKVIGNGLAGTALLWMLSEANQCTGLAIDKYRLLEELAFAIDEDLNRSSPLWSAIDALQVFKQTFKSNPSWRVRTRRLRIDDAWNVRVASSALEKFRTEIGYRPKSLTLYMNGSDAILDSQVEDVERVAAREKTRNRVEKLRSFIDSTFVGSVDLGGS